MRGWTRMCAAVMGAGVLCGAACACPLCDSGTGSEVRAGIFGPGLIERVAAGVLPFAAAMLMSSGLGTLEARRVRGRGT